MMVARLVRVALAGAALLLLCAGCDSRSQPRAAATDPVTVAVEPVAQLSVRDTVELDGTVAPSASVNMMARVAGVLEQVRFHDGDVVHKGQLLFTIEPATYQAQLKLYEARREQASSEYARQANLLAENATSQANVDTALSRLRQAEADLQLATINLAYTRVLAPFDGVIGRSLVDAGNVVGTSPGGTVLATVQRLSPAYVNFSVNERDALRLRERLRTDGLEARRGVGSVRVRVALQGQERLAEEGVLDFIDSTLNQGTGAIAMRARFSNIRRQLIPGLYAKVSIDIGEPRAAWLVPQSAVQTDQSGPYVFVLDHGEVARRRDVELGAVFGARREVVRGVSANDSVIASGLAGVTEGQRVLVRQAHP